MILSVSRRTDIPAFFSEWFFQRLQEGYACVRNPRNPRQVSRVSLHPELVDGIVFWTKDPSRMLPKLELLDDYHYYFQITVTGYDAFVEPHLAPKEAIIASFQELARRVGKTRTIWRYDPIIITKTLNKDFHLRQFTRLASALADSTDKCVISFVDLYRKTTRNTRSIGPLMMDKERVLDVAEGLAHLAQRFGLSLEACSEQIDLTPLGIRPGKCIDNALIAKIRSQPLQISRDKHQREDCNCVSSVDLGAYNTCAHGCIYCYANFSPKSVQENLARYNPLSPLLCSEIGPTDSITERRGQRPLPTFPDLF